ncbi:cysteine hydrolase family protein [Cypionkella psychrotolerans]|uniref:cysteine hydrolase family protein n=1 Tax=Cypionkella psychrotolerans TaxID=1678131 RepID=UPI0006B4E771|nr:cysteine hydrolase [Cypionkella psychrotolerans]
MQNYNFDLDIVSRIQATRGTTRLMDRLDPSTTAHVVIDLQAGFMREGALLEVPDARGIVPAVNAISKALRAAGGLVAFTRFAFLKDEPAYWNVFYSRFLDGKRAAAQMEAFSPGSPDLELWAGLDVGKADLVADKTRYSAFTHGTCDLDAALRARGIKTLIITGTMTNCCCESTARDAMQLGYDVIFASDATATLTAAEQKATLMNMAMLFAELATAAEIVAVLRAQVAAKSTIPASAEA